MLRVGRAAPAPKSPRHPHPPLQLEIPTFPAVFRLWVERHPPWSSVTTVMTLPLWFSKSMMVKSLVTSTKVRSFLPWSVTSNQMVTKSAGPTHVLMHSLHCSSWHSLTLPPHVQGTIASRSRNAKPTRQLLFPASASLSASCSASQPSLL